MKTNLPARIPLSASQVELHYKRPLFSSMAHITCAKDAVHYLKQYINTHQLDLRESFWVILMTSANRILGISQVATGTSRSVQTNIKYILQLVLLSNASSVLASHCHPSGNLNPSKKDIAETKKLQRLLKLMEVTLLDHIIITSESFLSFAQEDIL